MPNLLANYRTTVRALIQDKATKLDATGLDEAIHSAVEFHSKVRPDVRRRSIAGNATDTVATPTGWENEVSQITQIEFPVNETPPTYLEEDAWLLKGSPTASTRYQIQFQATKPGTGERFNLTWTVPHTMNATSTTIPTGHFRAVAHLAAAVACEALAAFYSQSGDSSINADSMNPQQKNPNYRDLARDYRKHYNNFFGINDKQVPAAAVIWDLDRTFSWGQDFMHHNRRWR